MGGAKDIKSQLGPAATVLGRTWTNWREMEEDKINVMIHCGDPQWQQPKEEDLYLCLFIFPLKTTKQEKYTKHALIQNNEIRLDCHTQLCQIRHSCSTEGSRKN